MVAEQQPEFDGGETPEEIGDSGPVMTPITEIATIRIIPVVYQKDANGDYVLDLRGERMFLKMGNAVEASDDWEPYAYEEYVNFPKTDVVTNLAEYGMSKTFLDVIVPSLVENKIYPGLVLYENFPNIATIYANDDFDAALFKSTLQTEISNWAGITNYRTYFNNYPHDLQIAFESYVLGGMHGDGLDIPGITNAECFASIGLLNETVTAAKEVTPSSRVYHYNAPLLPYNMPSPVLASDWYQRSNYTTDDLYNKFKPIFLQRFEDKVKLIRKASDVLNIEGYLKHFAGYTYPSPPLGAGYPNQDDLKANGTKEHIYISCKEAYDNISTETKRVQLQMSPVVFSGYSLGQLNTVEKIQALDSLIWSNTDLTNYIMKPAKDAGARSMFIWGSWYYDTILAGRPLNGVWDTDNDNLTLLKRKMFNDLFNDTGFTGTIGLTNDSAWAAQNTKLDVLRAATQKTVSLAVLFSRL